MPSTNPKGKVLVMLTEPVWTTERGVKVALSQIPNEHLQRIERWLRGQGATKCPYGTRQMWYPTIKAELDRRKLEPLAKHIRATTREADEWDDAIAGWPEDTLL